MKFSPRHQPDWQGLVDCIRRRGTPQRVHFIELFLDDEVQQSLSERFGLLEDLDRCDPFFEQKKQIRLQRFLGYDYVSCTLEGLEMRFNEFEIPDTAPLARPGGRRYMTESRGPITSWEEFERYPWPDPARATTRALEWFEKNLPDDMCIIAFRGFGHFAEHLTWLMGYETLCYALYEQRDLVQAISDKVVEISRAVLQILLQFDRVKLIWGSDDMGFKTSTLISPDDLRQFVLPGHRLMARMSHEAGRPYLLHSCGNLRRIMPDLIESVKIDAKHSFEDTIESVTEAKETYGRHIALLGGIDVDFLCRATPEQIRRRVRHTLEVCQPGGGYCLGTGNTVANYIPLDNYLTMLDEAARFSA